MVFLITRDRLGPVSWTAPSAGVRPGRRDGQDGQRDGHCLDTTAARTEPPAQLGGGGGVAFGTKKRKMKQIHRAQRSAGGSGAG